MDWKSGYQWILNTGVSVENPRPIETLLDFADSFRDGRILCGILNIMEPGCIEFNAGIKNANHNEFSCVRNISIFLETCKNTFHLEQEQLFSKDDLYELKDFKKVMEALSLLSHTVAATEKLSRLPFLPQGCLNQQDELSMLAEQIWKVPINDLKQNVQEKSDHQGFKKAGIFSSTPKCSKTDDFLQYCEQNEYLPRKLQSTERISAAPAGDLLEELEVATEHAINGSTNALQLPEGTATTCNKRYLVVQEILESEESYLTKLKTMVSVFIPTLQKFITKEEKKNIFLNLEEIYKLHQSFHRVLQSQLRGGNKSIDFSVFIQYKDRFLIYAYYCSFLEDSKTKCKTLLTKKSGFQKALNQLKVQHKIPTLCHYSIQILQRILKYSMLIQRMRDTMDETSKDMLVLNQALAAMKDVNEYINQYQADMPLIKEIIEIEATLNRDLSLKMFGRPVRNGKVKLHCAAEKKYKDCFAFLFEHKFLMCEVDGNRKHVKYVFDMENIQIRKDDSCPEKFLLIDAKETVKWNLILTRGEEEAKSWMESVKNCQEIVREIHEDGENSDHRHIFRLTTFDEKSNVSCGVCGLLLKGLIDQGYRCEQCQLSAHRTCLRCVRMSDQH